MLQDEMKDEPDKPDESSKPDESGESPEAGEAGEAGNDNPYQSPDEEAVKQQPKDIPQRLVPVIAKYHQQKPALGVIWIMTGAVFAGLGAFLTMGNEIDGESIYLMVKCGLAAALFVTLGIMILKDDAGKGWHIKSGIIVSMVYLVTSLITLAGCSIMLVIPGIIHAYTVNSCAKKILRAGYPLDTKPPKRKKRKTK